MSLHSILSPSSAHRRLRCIGSLAATKGIPNPNTPFSAEGTAYHWVASSALESGKDCADYVGMVVNVQKSGEVAVGLRDANTEYSFTINDSDAAEAQVYVDAIRRRSGHKMYEVRIDTSVIVGVPGQGGTGDAITLDYERETIWVDDLKFGRRETVYASYEEGDERHPNEQCAEYGAGALWMFDMLADWKYVGMAIHQPRQGHYDEFVMPVDDLRKWVERIRPLEQQAYKLWESGTREQIAAALSPSDKGCRWCPISGSCAARTRRMLDMFPAPPAAPAAVTMSDAELAQARDRIEDLESWAAAIKSEAYARALNGAKLPGWKLIDGKLGNRSWDETKVDEIEDKLVATLGDAAYQPRKVLTAAGACDLLKLVRGVPAEVKAVRHALKTELEKKYIIRPPGAKQLVREERAGVAFTPPAVEFPEPVG